MIPTDNTLVQIPAQILLEQTYPQTFDYPEKIELPTTINPKMMDIENNKISYENNFNIYPNPTDHQLTIEYNFEDGLKDHDIIIYDLKGKQIQLLSVNEKPGKQIINVSKFPEGNYIITVKNENRILYSKQISITH